jgi:pyridoxal phosphate enzyme (YggS family)
MTLQQITDNFLNVRSEITDAAKKAGRNPHDIKLCAVSKFHPIQSIYDALKADQFLFGENRVQEAYEKFNVLNNDDSLKVKPTLHIIGSLQLNKVKHAVAVATCIQSVDRLELIEEIEKQCAKLDKKINILFEVHTGEESKSGYRDTETLRQSIQQCASGMYPHVVPNGFMTMAPLTQDESAIHKSFSDLRSLQQSFQSEFSSLSLHELSMGMSADFKIAIEEGSTMVRIGTALFGPREINTEEAL